MSEITMPKMSDTMEEGKVIRWLKNAGDRVAQGEPIAEIETDKANVEMEAFEAGVLGDVLVHEGDTVPVGAVMATIEAVGTPSAPPQEAKPVEEQPVAPPQVAAEQPPPEATRPVPPVIEQPIESPEEERVKASPLARRMAEENGIDLARIQGTGPNGRIVEADVEKLLGQAKAPEAPRLRLPHPRPLRDPRRKQTFRPKRSNSARCARRSPTG